MQIHSNIISVAQGIYLPKTTATAATTLNKNNKNLKTDMRLNRLQHFVKLEEIKLFIYVKDGVDGFEVYMLDYTTLSFKNVDTRN